MSIWQFAAAAEGFAKSQGAAKDKLSATEQDDLWEFLTRNGEQVSRKAVREFDPADPLPIESLFQHARRQSQSDRDSSSL